MRFITIVNTRIPTEKAHGYQISKVCEEVARAGVQTELWLPARKTHTDESVFEFYGLEKNFTVQRFGSFDAFSLEKYAGARAAFFLQSALFLFFLAFAHVPKDAVVYTRNPEIAFVFSMLGKKVFYNAHSFPESKQKLLHFFLQRTKGIVCNSKGTEEAFQRAGFKNTFTISNGVDLAQFRNLPEKNMARKISGLSHLEGKRIALYVGHFYAWKGVDVIFEAAEKTKDDASLQYVLVGGTPEDFAKYEALRKTRGLQNILLLPYKKKTEIPTLLAAVDVLLLPNIPVTRESEKYTSPIKMFEYMASGTPIVASRLPSLREVLNDENSVLVKAGGANALVFGIQKIVSEKEYSNRIAARAKEDAKLYTWRVHTETLIAFFQKKSC